MNIIGHKEILTFFEKATTADRLHHAYLFVGRSKLGKRTVAEHLAKQIFEDTEKSLSINPDIFFLQRGIDKKTEKTKKNISIEQVHELRHFLQGKPFLYKKKIAIIDNAELLSRGAMNALLKTLEEPRGDVTLFLIATDESMLLETIRSRCQTLYFHPVEMKNIQEYLVSTNIDSYIAESMAIHAAGLPGRAVAWAEDMDGYEWYKKEVARCKDLFSKPLYKKLEIVDELFGKKDDHIKTRATLIDVLDIWQLVIREQYTQQYSDSSQSYDIVKTNNAIIEAKKGLMQNVHPRMLIEQVLLTIS
jgi:DNA polymerase III subunit delta'